MTIWSMRSWEFVPGPTLSSGARIPRIAWTIKNSDHRTQR